MIQRWRALSARSQMRTGRFLDLGFTNCASARKIGGVGCARLLQRAKFLTINAKFDAISAIKRLSPRG